MAVRLISQAMQMTRGSAGRVAVAALNSEACKDCRTYHTKAMNKKMGRASIATATKSSLYEDEHEEHQEPPTNITIRDVCDGVLDDSIVLVDVRQPHEIAETGRIGHSLNIPVSHIAEAFSLSEETFQKLYRQPKPDPQQDNVVLYDRSGERASKACGLLKKIGFSKIKHYPGGIDEWQSVLLGNNKLSPA